ncbi:isoprenylcysteine carboxylmethyltransferase family protein [Pararhizobium sp. BT-229]|uniref:methyltransferase family protein n=1 Tax=Pararhizobium sp. BT-229 TaxID=2986923 RepID=UPI0021F7790C|nr:isoprenylcysteine carboxylmethyltransferase family protein [Pararhizobium sp. BT-229]MCV9964637.1 isoprenylcysteine carboxylmethyltransferase family protein [Pararhizobium sp. BT-229]
MSLFLDGAVTACGFLVVAMYSWSMKGHFTTDRIMGRVKVLSAFVLATAFLFTWAVWGGAQNVFVQAFGLVLQLASAILFVSAVKASRAAKLTYAFDGGLPKGLATKGPYAYVRHPFYSSYIVFWTGWAVATGTVWASLAVAFFIAIYIRAARQEERALSSAPFAKAYDAYRAKTGFMIPKLG